MLTSTAGHICPRHHTSATSKRVNAHAHGFSVIIKGLEIVGYAGMLCGLLEPPAYDISLIVWDVHLLSRQTASLTCCYIQFI